MSSKRVLFLAATVSFLALNHASARPVRDPNAVSVDFNQVGGEMPVRPQQYSAPAPMMAPMPVSNDLGDGYSGVMRLSSPTQRFQRGVVLHAPTIPLRPAMMDAPIETAQLPTAMPPPNPVQAGPVVAQSTFKPLKEAKLLAPVKLVPPPRKNAETALVQNDAPSAVSAVKPAMPAVVAQNQQILPEPKIQKNQLAATDVMLQSARAAAAQKLAAQKELEHQAELRSAQDARVAAQIVPKTDYAQSLQVTERELHEKSPPVSNAPPYTEASSNAPIIPTVPMQKITSVKPAPMPPMVKLTAKDFATAPKTLVAAAPKANANIADLQPAPTPAAPQNTVLPEQMVAATPAPKADMKIADFKPVKPAVVNKPPADEDVAETEQPKITVPTEAPAPDAHIAAMVPTTKPDEKKTADIAVKETPHDIIPPPSSSSAVIGVAAIKAPEGRTDVSKAVIAHNTYTQLPPIEEKVRDPNQPDPRKVAALPAAIIPAQNPPSDLTAGSALHALLGADDDNGKKPAPAPAAKTNVVEEAPEEPADQTPAPAKMATIINNTSPANIVVPRYAPGAKTVVASVEPKREITLSSVTMPEPVSKPVAPAPVAEKHSAPKVTGGNAPYVPPAPDQPDSEPVAANDTEQDNAPTRAQQTAYVKPVPQAAPKPSKVATVSSKPSADRLIYPAEAVDVNDVAAAPLDQWAQKLIDDPRVHVQVKSYASKEQGSSSEARRVSMKRGLAVRDYLIEKGVPSNRIDVRALGYVEDAVNPPDRVDIQAM